MVGTHLCLKRRLSYGRVEAVTRKVSIEERWEIFAADKKKKTERNGTRYAPKVAELLMNLALQFNIHNYSKYIHFDELHSIERS